MLLKFHHTPPETSQDDPYPCNRPTYDIKVQMTNDANKTALLQPTGIMFLQRVTGKCLYYEHAVDLTTLVALSYL